jgi:hypothetical protein
MHVHKALLLLLYALEDMQTMAEVLWTARMTLVETGGRHITFGFNQTQVELAPLQTPVG